MSSSRQLFVVGVGVGVGVLLAIGQAPAGVAQLVQSSASTQETAKSSNSAQEAVTPDEPNAASSQATPKKPLTEDFSPANVELPTPPQSAIVKTGVGVKPAKLVKSSIKPKVKPKVKPKSSSDRAAAAAATPINLSDFKAGKWHSQAAPLPGSNTPPSGTPPSNVSPPTSSPSTGPATAPTNPGANSTTPTGNGITPSKPIGPAKPGLAPEYLNPNPNPLAFPTRPEDVRLRGIQPITLQQAIDLAKRNNRDLQIAGLQLNRSRASLREQQAALYPSLSVQSNVGQSESAASRIAQSGVNQGQQLTSTGLGQTQTIVDPTTGAVIGTTGGTTTGTNIGGTNIGGTTTGTNIGGTTTGTNIGGSQSTSSTGNTSNLALSGTLALRYDIFTSGQRPALIRAAERQLRSDQLQVEVIEQQLRLDTATAYYNLQQADENVRIQQSAVRNAQASLRDTQAQERAGLGTRFDVLRAQVQLARVTQDLTTALSTQQTRRREIARLLAAPPNVDLAAADPVQIAGTWGLSLPESIVLAFKHRAELEQFLAQRELAEQRRKAALAALGPTVSLQVEFNTLDLLRDDAGFGYGYSVGLGLNWNFFDGGAARARANQFETNKAIAEAQFAQSRENIQLQVETFFLNLQSSFLNIGTNRQAVVQATEALRLARLRFQAGVGTQTDVINAENDLILAEGALVTSIINYNVALASLQRYVTNLPIPTGAATPSIPAPAPATL